MTKNERSLTKAIEGLLAAETAMFNEMLKTGGNPSQEVARMLDLAEGDAKLAVALAKK